ncbi:MAG TPA: iron ABC transporter permease [Gaiellaceae bacterium]|jgi:iron(III) transport system permease protein|nr:iron ABC transporter permease [Gaiellaceae bacterium]
MTVAAVPAKRRAPAGLLSLGILVAAAVAVPLVFLLLEAAQVGWATIKPLIFRELTATLLWNTVRLTVAVTVICAVLGVATAWCIERTDVPWRRFWAVVLVLPLAMPDFVLGYGWISIAPGVSGYWGSVLVMSLGSYPLVYLPVAAALRTADPSLEDVARGLGLGRFRTFTRVTLHQIRPALFGGSLLVALILLAEFGTFEILRFQTFTTQIYTEIQIGYSTTAGCALSLVLVLLGLLVLGAEAAGRGRAGAARRGQAGRRATRVRLGWWAVLVIAGIATLLVLAIGVPLYALGYWFVEGTSSTLPSISIFGAAVSTALYSAAAAALATVAAIPIALLVERHRSRLTVTMERSTYLVQAIPGIVVALSLVYFTIRYLPTLYQSSFALVFAYAIMFFPLALVAVRAGVAQAPPGLEEVARSLGHGRLSVLMRITLPVLAPALVAGFSLVFITSSTELTATLILHPTGVNTLATGFWAFTNNFAYGAAAPYALALLIVATLPGLVLGRWFERIAGAAT